MSFQHVSWAMRQAECVSPLERLILMCLAEYANHDTGWCCPSQSKIAEHCMVTRQTVNEHVNELARRGVIRMQARARKDGGRTSNCYVFPMIKFVETGFADSPYVGDEGQEDVGADTSPPVVPSRQQEQVTSLTGRKNKKSSVELVVDDSPPVARVPLVNGSDHVVTQNRVGYYRSLYPAVDVIQEFRKMIGWCNANPTQRKTARGIERFINSWLSRAQDRGGGGGYRNGHDQGALPMHDDHGPSIADCDLPPE